MVWKILFFIPKNSGFVTLLAFYWPIHNVSLKFSGKNASFSSHPKNVWSTLQEEDLSLNLANFYQPVFINTISLRWVIEKLDRVNILS